MSENSPQRNFVALGASVLPGPIMVWTGLIAALSLIQQVLAGFLDLTEASWSRFPRWDGKPLRNFYGFCHHYCPVFCRNQVCKLIKNLNKNSRARCAGVHQECRAQE